jgi:peptide/nickel transport system substrate-binding protein
MTNAPAATAALKAGDVDVFDDVTDVEVDSVRQDTSLRVLEAHQLGWQGLRINIGNRNGVASLPYANVGTPLAASPKLRQAFEEAIDRNAMNRVVFADHVEVTCTLIPPSNARWYDALKVPCTPYDPKHARKLVAESGLPSPTVRLLVSNTTTRLRLAQFIQAQEAAVGINVVIDPADNATSLARERAGDYEMRIAGGVSGGVDPDARFTAQVATTGSANAGGYSNPRLDLILANARKATDFKARSTLYRAAQEIISNDRPIIFLYSPVTFAAVRTDVAGVRLTSDGSIDVVHARYR